MKKKSIISIIVTIGILTLVTGGIVISKNISKTEATENKVEKNDENATEANGLKEVDSEKSNELENLEVSNENTEQDTTEGYAIYSKSISEYKNGNYDEAIRLFETITNKDVRAKDPDYELQLYLGKEVDNKFYNAEELYNNGKYEHARSLLVNLIGGNYMPDKQKEKANSLLEKINSKLANSEKKEFTYELALEYLKQYYGKDGYSYKMLEREIDSDGGIGYFIEITSDESKDVYLVQENGHISGD